MSYPLSNKNRQRTARIEVEKKLAVLRRYVLEGITDGVFVPQSVAQFRRWEDDALDLNRIGSPNTLNSRSSPHNQDIIDELSELLTTLKRLQKKPKRVRPTVEESTWKSNYECRELKKLNASLASRVHELRDELESQKQRMQQEKTDLKILNAEVSTLRKRLAALATSNGISRVK
jgi:chromosome segregation ATPase